MTRTMVSAIVVLGTAALAVAGPAFTLPAIIAEVPNTADALVTVNLGAEAGAVEGMNLYLEVAAPLEITDLNVDLAGTVFFGNTSGALTGGFWDGQTPTPQMAFGLVTTAAGTADTGVLPAAIAMVKVPAGTPVGDYFVTTDLTNSIGVKSDWADSMDSGQATGMIRVIVPEPMSAMLLLAGLPLLRRRHA